MKDNLSLYKEKDNRFYYMPHSKPTPLYDLYMFITNDYASWDTELFTQETRNFNMSFIFNDLKNKIAYIGLHYNDENFVLFQDDGPEPEDYLNETNSCKISVDNFNEFIKNWKEVKKTQLPFAVIYRNDNDWVDCKGFLRKEEMEFFVKDPGFEILH